MQDTTANTARCLDAFNAPAHLRVHAGVNKGILKGLTEGAQRIHGEDGLAGVEGLPELVNFPLSLVQYAQCAQT